MLPRIIALIALLGIVEILILIALAGAIGFWPTAAIVAASALLGMLLATTESRRVVSRMQQDLAFGRMPTYGLADHVLVLVGGALLIFPGLLTDVAGLALMLPAVRSRVKGRARGAIERALVQGTFRIGRMG